MIKYDVMNRWNGSVQFTAEINATEADSGEMKLGLAVQWGAVNGASLVGASLDGARLDGARLDGARLDGATENGTPIDAGSNCLRPFKADFWLTLSEHAAEVPALIDGLKSGRVDGSTYEGECACLVGTIANARGVSHKTLSHGAERPAERWFAMIRKGDRPGDRDSERMTSGGFAAHIALAWAEQWMLVHGVGAKATA